MRHTTNAKNLIYQNRRLEKGYLNWKSDIITEFNPFETGLDRFVKMDKNFIGKEALEHMIAAGNCRNLVTLELDSRTTPAHPSDSILKDSKVVGTVTSADWGYQVGKNLAYAFVDPAATKDLAALVLGEEIPCKITDKALYDPTNKRVRQF